MKGNLRAYRAEDLQHFLVDTDNSKSLHYPHAIKDKLELAVATAHNALWFQTFIWRLINQRSKTYFFVDPDKAITDADRKAPTTVRINLSIDVIHAMPACDRTSFKGAKGLGGKKGTEAVQAAWKDTMALCARFNCRVLVMDDPMGNGAAFLDEVFGAEALKAYVAKGFVELIESAEQYILKAPKSTPSKPWVVWDPKDTKAVTKSGGYALIKMTKD